MKKVVVYLLPYIAIPIYAFLLLFIVEGIYRGFSAMPEWVKTQYHEFTLVYVFFLSIFFIFHIFKRKIFLLLSLVFSLLTIILSVANKVKLTVRGDPLIPADMLLISEASTMVSYLSATPMWQIVTGGIIIILLLAAIIYAIIKMPKEKTWNWHRVVIGILACSMFTYIYYQEVEASESAIRSQYHIDTIDYNQAKNYQMNGFVMGFTRNLKWLSIDPPEDYNEQKIAELTERYSEEPYEKDGKKPHIVMIMSEAFWDPTRMDSISFNKDPLEYFHSLSEEHTSGDILAPVFGGSTANTEFEALTGLSMNYLPDGSIPYQFYMKKPVQALPSLLKEQGYETTAIHSYYNWFYQRNSVYKNIGFDQFIPLEFITDPVVDFKYYRDREVNDMIIEQITNADKPNFVFAVTMQNHGPYVDNMKKDYAEIEVEMKEADGKLSESSQNILEFYSDNIQQMDLELQRMIESFEELDEDVMVVYFGDHLPLLGANDQVYREANYFFDDSEYEDYLKKYSAPLLIWDNFSEEREDLTISPAYLPAYILAKSGLEGTSLTNLQNEALNSGNGLFPRKDFLDQIDFDSELYNSYQLLQYDALFGRKYDESFVAESNEDFRLGASAPAIKSVEKVNQEGQAFAVVQGDHLTRFTKVFVNGEQLETSFNEGELKATLPNADTTGEIQAKIIDTNGTILTETNILELEN
ncbi:LTA synthase family protein [Metaplanococcus flavidus]|uniref:LTA synthase family protein n=1 Tax=Metaplanococcus flavidus TaxID=569883 RepID=A0ABW3LDL9_9BACL